jgi:hypothetical protein
MAALDHGAAVGADQPHPTGWITTLIDRLGDLRAPADGEELDREADRTQGLQLVIDLGRNGLCGSDLKLDVDDRSGGGSEAHTSVMDDNPTPRACRDAVGAA